MSTSGSSNPRPLLTFDPGPNYSYNTFITSSWDPSREYLDRISSLEQRILDLEAIIVNGDRILIDGLEILRELVNNDEAKEYVSAVITVMLARVDSFKQALKQTREQ